MECNKRRCDVSTEAVLILEDCGSGPSLVDIIEDIMSDFSRVPDDDGVKETQKFGQNWDSLIQECDSTLEGAVVSDGVVEFS